MEEKVFFFTPIVPRSVGSSLSLFLLFEQWGTTSPCHVSHPPGFSLAMISFWCEAIVLTNSGRVWGTVWQIYNNTPRSLALSPAADRKDCKLSWLTRIQETLKITNVLFRRNRTGASCTQTLQYTSDLSQLAHPHFLKTALLYHQISQCVFNQNQTKQLITFGLPFQRL